MRLIEALHSFFSFKDRELKTVWEVRKDRRGNFLAGTAHFLPYRLRKSLDAFIRPMKTVLFEGPLDQESMNEVVSRGSGNGGAAILYQELDRDTLQRVKRCLGQPFEEPVSLVLPPFVSPTRDPLHEHFQGLRPWMAFFEIWTHFLKGRGWKYSVDLEALEIATQMGKEVVFLETIEEQVAALEGIPLERLVNFLKKIDRWGKFADAHARLYVRGELPAMMGSTHEFPSRCPSIVEQRDPVLFERMKRFFEKGDAIAFVGTPHIPGIQGRFLAEGYMINQVKKAGE